MDAMEFVNSYQQMLCEIANVTAPQYDPAIEALLFTDPEDLVTPAAYFDSRTAALGFIFTLFAEKCKEMQLIKQDEK